MLGVEHQGISIGGLVAGAQPAEVKLPEPGEKPRKRGSRPQPGGFNTKVYLQTEGGKLITLVVTLGQRPVDGQGTGKGPTQAQAETAAVVGDKGCSSQAIRRYACQHGIRITIPRKHN